MICGIQIIIFRRGVRFPWTRFMYLDNAFSEWYLCHIKTVLASLLIKIIYMLNVECFSWFKKAFFALTWNSDLWTLSLCLGCVTLLPRPKHACASFSVHPLAGRVAFALRDTIRETNAVQNIIHRRRSRPGHWHGHCRWGQTHKGEVVLLITLMWSVNGSSAPVFNNTRAPR